MANDTPEFQPGISTAIDNLKAEDIEAVQPEQLDMFSKGSLKPLVNGRGQVVEALPERTGRPGRPKGATNKSTRAWTDYILGRYRSPLIFLAETMGRSVRELADELDCDRLEAFKIQMVAAGKLAEYVHQKQPVSADREGVSAGKLVINTDAPEDATGQNRENRPNMRLHPPRQAPDSQK